MRKGLDKVLFDGTIRKISEKVGGEDAIEVTCIGHLAAFGDVIHNVVFSDVRTSEWDTMGDDEIEDEVFDRFTVSESDGIVIEPKSVHFGVDNYGGSRYAFSTGESVRRISLDYELELPYGGGPSGWPGKAAIVDDADTELWSSDTTGSGSVELYVDTDYIELRFYVTQSGENTASSGTVYVKFSNVVVYSKEDDVVDLAVLLKDLIAELDDHGISQDTRYIDDVGVELKGAAFENDQPIREIAEWGAKFGTENNKPLAWGIRFTDDRIVFLEEQDLTAIKYLVMRDISNLEADVTADFDASAQKVYVTYRTPEGDVVRTSMQEASDIITEFDGRYKMRVVDVGDVPQDQAETILSLVAEAAKKPVVSSSYAVGGSVLSATRKFVSFDEITPGGLVQIVDFRAHKAALTRGDFRDNVTTFMLVAVEVDYDAGTAKLTPSGDHDTVDRYLAKLAELSRSET